MLSGWASQSFTDQHQGTPLRTCVDPVASTVYTNTFHSPAPLNGSGWLDFTWELVSANRNSLIYDSLDGISSEMLVDNIKKKKKQLQWSGYITANYFKISRQSRRQFCYLLLRHALQQIHFYY